jgi:predicted double-glycine peptidase
MRILALIALACSAQALGKEPDKQFLGNTFLSDVRLSVRSMAALKFTGVVRQRYDFSCGSAALATLLQMYGDRLDEATTFRGMWSGGDREQIRRLGFSLLDMQRYLKTRGIEANGYKVELDQIARTSLPGIALIAPRGYRHFVVIQGVADGRVLVADPSLGLRVQTVEQFGRDWNGVYFVLESRPDQGKGAFNQPSRRAAYPRAPLASRFADPLSQQHLLLTRSGFGEF